MICSLCGKEIEKTPGSTYIIWKGKPVGQYCYQDLVRSLQAESIEGDESLLYNYDGIFSDPETNKRYRISQTVTAGRGNMGYSVSPDIEEM